MTYQFAYQEIAQALYLALKHEPFYAQLEQGVPGDTTQRATAMRKYFDYSMRAGRKYGALFVPEKAHFGASVWSKPVNGPLAEQIAQEKKAFLHQHLGAASLKAYTDMVAFMAAQTAGIVPPGSWYLSIVGINPKLQGQGLGVTLLQPIFAQIDPAGTPSYLETFTPRNIPFYQRLGYQIQATFIEPVTGREYWLMLRKTPQS